MIANFVNTVRKANRLVVGGMFFFNSPGHMIAESDYLLRLISRYPLIKARSPIVILPPTPMATMIGDILKLNGVTVFMDPNAVGILREIQLFHPDLILEVGQAHCKLVVPDTRGRGCGDLGALNLCWALHGDEFMTQLVNWHEAWNATRGELPLRDAVMAMSVDATLLALLEKRPYAVLQIKTTVINGTARVLPGEAYRPALELLRDEGYSIILAGREPMPEEFKRFGVFDYPRSQFANPKNDFFLFSRAKVGLVSPSGAGLFCDTLGVPCCQIGSYTLLAHPSEKTLMVPSRLTHKDTSQVLSFSAQAMAFRLMYHEVNGPGFFDTKNYVDIPPTPEDILAGLHETLHGSSPSAVPYPLARLQQLDPIGIWRVSASKISSAFLGKHPDFIN